MTIKQFLLAALPLLASTLMTAQEVAINTAPTTSPKDSITSPSSSATDFSKLQDNLVAGIDPVKASDYLKSINYNSEQKLLEELKNPSIDLYGENSWTQNVDPFAGISGITIPDSYDIDCKDFVYPLDGIRRVNSHYGYRRRFRRMHYGVDIQLQVGDSVRSVFDGKIRIVDNEARGYGRYVVVRHTNGLETVYGHLSKQLIKEGDIVRAGDVIALGGNTGRSTGPHLHLEFRFMGIPINPEQVIDFASGIPQNEIYAFNKNSYSRSKSTLASNGRKRNSKGTGSNIQIHKIRKGDTLGSIARKHGTTVTKLCKLNGISKRTTLKIGRSLRVSS